ncbi:unnamed protein product [Porites evermanni]|uniref:G-protein coupled receptors family 1 profile domain-containing protein n=1 Tax=Porites evermanni TaxID=104178 RepID=A0ABN8MKN5_9CNID|nr:unnamed protein product [Porites evermanni]
MASSDLLYPIFVIPRRLSNLHTNYSFLIGGQLGQALCKLVPFFSNVSIVVLTHNLILIAVDRFGFVLFPLRSPLIRSKLCPFFILATWMFAIILISKDFLAFELTQAHPGEQSTNNQQQRKRKNGNVLQMSIAIVTVFVLCWLPFSTNHLMIAYQDSSAHFSCSFQIYLDNLVLIAVVRFGAVVFRTPFATHQIQAVSLLHSCHVDSCRSYIFAILVRQRAHGIPREKLMCYEMEESIRRVIVPY